MQLELLFRNQPAPKEQESLYIRGRWVRLSLVRNRRARRYVLRLSPDGVARVTIPRGGSLSEGRRFLQRNISWIERQLLRQTAEPAPNGIWTDGTEILFRGEPARIRVETHEGE